MSRKSPAQLDREIQEALSSGSPPAGSRRASRFLHGSKRELPVGDTLQARPNQGWFRPEIEQAMEERRPAGAPSRLASFFLVDRRELLRSAGAPTDYVYRVTPVGPLGKYHQGWMGEVYEAMIPFLRHRAPEEEKEAAAPKLARVPGWVDNYWRGVPYRHRPNQARTTWEFLAPTVRIDAAV